MVESPVITGRCAVGGADGHGVDDGVEVGLIREAIWSGGTGSGVTLGGVAPVIVASTGTCGGVIVGGFVPFVFASDEDRGGEIADGEAASGE